MAIRNYHFTDGVLSLEADKKAFLAERDLNELASYNYSQQKLDAFKQKAALFKNLPSDDYWEGLKVEKTEEKNKGRANLASPINEIRNRIRMVFGESSAVYRNLHVGDYSKISDTEIQDMALRIIMTARDKKTQLTEVGLTDAMITRLETQSAIFNDMLTSQKVFEMQRAEETEKRIIAGNELYTLLIEICEIGKNVWLGRDEAKYNEYLLYPGEAGNHEQVNGTGNITGLVTDFESGKTLTGVTVSVVIDETALTTTTDEQGEYALAEIPVGLYSVTATLTGYAIATQNNVEVSEDEDIPCDFQLKIPK